MKKNGPKFNVIEVKNFCLVYAAASEQSITNRNKDTDGDSFCWILNVCELRDFLFSCYSSKNLSMRKKLFVK